MELWSQHQTDHPKNIADVETDVDSTDGVESAVNSSAVRMFTYVSSEKGHKSGGSPLARVITATENCGSFAAVQLGGQLQSWYHDPGSLLSQMTTEEIAKCVPPLQRVSRERVHFVFAEHANSKLMNLYRAPGVCLVNPRTGATSKSVTTYILENPDLKVYPRVLGKNTLANLRVSTHHQSGTMSDDSGHTWALWAFTDELTASRDVGEFRDYIDKSCLNDAIQDYLNAVLASPPVDLSDSRLYDIRVDALNGVWGERFPSDPDYVYSDQQFLTAVRNSDEGYFMLSVLKDMALLQRLLKRSDSNFASFVVFMSHWFRDCPKLLQLWREVWAAGTVGRPLGRQLSVPERRERRLARLGFSPKGHTEKDPTDQRQVSSASARVKRWSDEERNLHARVATCHGPIGREPEPEVGDIDVHSSEEGTLPDTSLNKKTLPPGDDSDSSMELMKTTKAMFDTPKGVEKPGKAKVVTAISMGLGNPSDRIMGSDFPECKNPSTSEDEKGSPLSSPDESVRKLFDSSDSSLDLPDVMQKESNDDESPIFIVKPRQHSKRSRAVKRKILVDSDSSDYGEMLDHMPKGVLDKEARQLLRSPSRTRRQAPSSSGGHASKSPGLVTHSSEVRGLGGKSLTRAPRTGNKVNPSPTVRLMVEEAANQGAYIPVRIGDTLSTWYYDSGAGISQFTPEALRQLRPFLEKVDWDEVKFVTAKDISKTTMTLYRAKSCSLMQMESQVTSAPAQTYFLCNPHLKTYGRLFGVNSMKDLRLCDRHVNDVVEDELGRLFRKYSHNRLAQLDRSVQVWNRQRQRTLDTSRTRSGTVEGQAVESEFSSHSSPQLTATSRSSRVGRPHSPPEIEMVRVRLDNAEASDDRGVFANLMKSDMQLVQDILLRSPLKVESAYPNFKSFLKAKWVEDSTFGHAWKTLWSKRRRGLRKPSVRQDLYKVPPVPGPPLPPLPPKRPVGPPPVPLKARQWKEMADVLMKRVAQARHAQGKKGKSRVSSDLFDVDRTPSSGSTPKAAKVKPKESRDPLGWLPHLHEPHPLKTRTYSKDDGEDSQDAEDGHPVSNGYRVGANVRPSRKPPWAVDPTPPWLKSPISFKVTSFPESALEVNPDLYLELRGKSVKRWTRPFTAHAMGGSSRILRQEKEMREMPMWMRPRKLAGHSILALPGHQTVKKLCKSLLKAQQFQPSTSALLLIPEDMLGIQGVREFLHAYCLKGETFRGGPLFRRRGSESWMHLNQAVHEFWFDAIKPALPHLSPEQQKELEEFEEEFQDCLGDSNTSNAKRQSTASGKIPYVRLPVKADYKRSSEAPFKKNPKTRQLTIDFVRDMEKRGLVSRCTNEELEFVCNSLMLPKGNEKYRFVCTFSGLNANMVRDPYGMRTLDAVLTALEGRSWFSVLDVVDGFFNLPLYPADRGFTAFHTPIGGSRLSCGSH